MKKFRSKSLVVAALLAATGVVGVMLVRAQEATTSTTSIVPQSPVQLQSIESYSDAQLKQMLNDLAQTPLIWPANLPNGGDGGTYWSLAHPNWPPLPSTFGAPVWNLSPYSSSTMSAGAMSTSSTISDSSFLVMDDVDYPPSPGTNSNGGTNVYSFQPMGLTINTNGLWIEVPTNAYSLASNYFNVLIHNTACATFVMGKAA